MQPSDLYRALLQRMEPDPESLSRAETSGYDVIRAGPLYALMDPDPSLPRDQVVPVQPLTDDRTVRRALQTLRQVFNDRGRRFTIEFNDPPWDGLADLLAGEGLRQTEAEPLMLLTPDEFRSRRNPLVNVHFLLPGDPDSDLAAYQHIFYSVLAEKPWQPTPEAIEGIRRQVSRAKPPGHALAHLDGRAVGTGYITLENGTAEITRVATVPDARRQGVAASVCSFMLEQRFEQGADLAWLTAANPGAQLLYQSLGFVTVGMRRSFGD